MATSKIPLSELKPGRCSRTVVSRFSVLGSYKCEERSNNDFKLLDSIVAIRLHEFTKLVKVHDAANHIPTEMFMFRELEQVIALTNTNVELQCDTVRWCQGAGDCFISGVDDLLSGVATTNGATSHVPSVSEYYSVKFPNTSDVNVLRFGCIVASDAAMTNVTNVRAVEVPHLMGQGEEQDPRNPSKKAWT
ncbi:unnamed protein product [Brassica oleracea]